jgi:hypothetical protein
MEQIRQLLGKMEKWDTKGKCGEEGHTLGKFRENGIFVLYCMLHGNAMKDGTLHLEKNGILNAEENG